MLEIKNLVKQYDSDGQIVRALDGISIDFPEKGLVFILGKSGSGKSTLLNMIGGLDIPDEGEIIVKGKSSKDFTQSDFDSYRNTFVGFVFQEFNILEEFSIEENISLALQLQSRPNDKEAVARLLEQVGLEGMGNRKPNTLSGGQRQRVAIARALIKNPEIIMADEPTGALDSNTSRQILETLKKLAETKLVLVVSHDRESAETFGERIIEIKDGRIISDKTKGLADKIEFSSNVSLIGGDTISIKDNENISESDAKQIIQAIKKNSGSSIITLGQNDVESVKRVCKILPNGEREVFSQTTENFGGDYNGVAPEFIKSHLPAKHAFKMGLSSLKVKPIRFIFTVFLSMIAFCVFGVLSTLMLYDSNYSLAESLKASNYSSILLNKSYDVTTDTIKVYQGGTEVVENSVTKSQMSAYTAEEVEKLNDNGLGLNFAGVFNFLQPSNETAKKDPFYPLDVINTVNANYRKYYNTRSIIGFTDCGAEFMERNGFTLLAGHYPNDPTQEEAEDKDYIDEVAVSEYIYNLYKHSAGRENLTLDKFVDGFKIEIKKSNGGLGIRTFRVCGVYKVSDLSKYKEVENYDACTLPESEKEALVLEMNNAIQYSFDTVMYVAPGFYNKYKNALGRVTYESIKTQTAKGINLTQDGLSTQGSGNRQVLPFSTVNAYMDRFEFYDVDGKKMDFDLGSKDILLTKEDFEKLTFDKSNPDAYSMYAIMGTASIRKTAKLTIKGYYTVVKGTIAAAAEPYIMSDTFLQGYGLLETYTENRKYSDYVDNGDGIYNYVLTNTDNVKEQIAFMLDTDGDYTRVMYNSEYNRLFGGEIISTINALKIIFLAGGGTMGVFAALMLLNFITTSISAKRKEIGILRAVGAGKNDIFRIFITESLLLAIICFVLASALAYVCSYIMNNVLADMFETQLLQFGFINILLIFVISMFISILSTIFPVVMEARKSPVESIRQI